MILQSKNNKTFSLPQQNGALKELKSYYLQIPTVGEWKKHVICFNNHFRHQTELKDSQLKVS